MKNRSVVNLNRAHKLSHSDRRVFLSLFFPETLEICTYSNLDGSPIPHIRRAVVARAKRLGRKYEIRKVTEKVYGA